MNSNILQFKQNRWILILITGLWIIVGFKEDYIIYKLTDFYYIIYPPESSDITPQASYIRAVYIFYNSVYCGLAIFIIHLYFDQWRITIIAIFFYVLLLVLTIILNELGKNLPFEPFKVTAYRLMTIIVSPLPVIILVPIVYLSKLTDHKKLNK